MPVQRVGSFHLSDYSAKLSPTSPLAFQRSSHSPGICALRIEIIMIVENAFGPYFAKCINRNMILACSHPMHENASVSINLVYKLYYCQLTCQNSHPIETQGSQQKGMMGQVRIEYFHFLWAFPPIIHPLCFSQKMAFHALGPLLYIVY